MADRLRTVQARTNAKRNDDAPERSTDPNQGGFTRHERRHSDSHKCRAAESQRDSTERLRSQRLTARAREGALVPETALASQQHGAALRAGTLALARQHHAGINQKFMDTRKQGVKVIPEKLYSSLGSFGTNAWAQKDELHAPKHATTTMLSYGIAAVPDWSHGIGKHDYTLDTADPHDQGIWLGTRYSRPQAKPAWKAGPRGPPDPRLARWRGSPPEPREPQQLSSSAKDTAFLAARAAARQAESKELDDLRAMGVGNISARTSSPDKPGQSFSDLAAAAMAAREASSSKSTGSLGRTRPSTAPGISSLWYDPSRRPDPPKAAPRVTRKPDTLLDDFSWVTSPWGGAVGAVSSGSWASATRKVLTMPKQSPVPELDLMSLNPNSKEKKLMRFNAPIVPSG